MTNNNPDFTMKLTIRVEHSYGVQESSYTDPKGKLGDELFWHWFMNIWPALGLDGIKEGIEENDQYTGE